MKILITGGSGFIGTNLIDLLMEKQDVTILNLDIKAPFKENHKKYWQFADIADSDSFDHILSDFTPDACIHLSAETEMKDEPDLEKAYPINSTHSKQFLKLLLKYKVRRIIVFSTQFVCGPSSTLPERPEDFWPHTNYGKSKVLLEQNTRSILKPGSFIIVRPTYIWGPYHFKNFWELLQCIEKRIYIHPSGKQIIRSYGYVKNICHQTKSLLYLDNLDRDWFYIGDPPIDSFLFVNQLSRNIINKPVRTLPRELLFGLAKFGDVTPKVIKFPFNSFRYRNMTTDYLTPMAPTFKALGDSPFSISEAISDFCDWYRLFKKLNN
jgi:nucleoside-diphosphate-sugar epimerase